MASPQVMKMTLLEEVILEKQRLVKMQLVILLHAHKCEADDDKARGQHQGSSGTFTSACTLAACVTMKEVLAHLKSCQLGSACPVTHCFESRRILGHWRICVNPACPVCGEFKAAINEGRANQAQVSVEQPALPGNPTNDAEGAAALFADLKLDDVQ